MVGRSGRKALAEKISDGLAHPRPRLRPMCPLFERAECSIKFITGHCVPLRRAQSFHDSPRRSVNSFSEKLE